MATIVEYTDAKPPLDWYPKRIVSPTRSGSCCFSDMSDLGNRERDGNWEFGYRRCKTCGFTVRFVTRMLPDEELLAQLRCDLAASLSRWGSY
jgi:hypothetical protein